MKLLVLFLSLTLSLSYSLPILGGYQPVSSNQAQSDNQIQSLINAGLEKIIKEGNFTTDLALSAINSVYQQTVGDATNYKFNCDFQDKEGQTIKATFEATYNYSTTVESVENLDYSVSSLSVSETVSSTFVKLSEESIKSSSSVKQIVEFGSKQVIKFALDAKKISTDSYQVSTINSVATQVVDSAVFYNCSADLKNSEDSTIKIVFTVYSQASMNVTVVIDYSYEVSNTVNNDIVQIIAPVESEYTSISIESIEKKKVIQNALNYGVEQLIKIGVKDEQLSSSNFTLSEVQKAYSQIIGCGVFYKFKVTLRSESADETVTATFEVYYQAHTKENKLTSYSYRVDSESSDDDDDLTYVVPVLTLNGNYTDCDESEIRENKAILAALNYGANQVVLVGAQEGNIPSSAYTLLQITSVKKQTTSAGTSYKFQIILTNKNGVIIETSFTVLDQESSDQLLLSSYSYQVNLNGYGSSSTEKDEDSDSEESTTTITVTVDVTITTTVTIGNPDYQTNTTTSNNTVKSPGENWILLTEEEIQDSVVQSCINYGMNNIIQIGIQLGSFPFSKWDLTEVIAVYQNNQYWGRFYLITLHLTSASGLKVDTTFQLSYNIATLLITRDSYYYNVGAFNSAKTVATTSGLNTTEATPSTNTTDLPFSASNEGLEYDSNGYYKIPIHWVDESVDIQNCINFGAPEVVKIGVKQNKIPVSNYIIYKVVWVQRYIGTKGDYYAIRLHLTNIYNVNLVLTFTTFINKSTKEISLYTYAYSVANVRPIWSTPGGTGSTNTTTVTNVTTLVSTGGWTALPALQIDNNQEVQDAISYGTKFITRVSIKSNSAPSGKYTVSKIKSVSTKATMNGVFYACEVVLTSSSNVEITTTFTVYFDRSSESYSMSTYQYQVTNNQDTISEDNGLGNSGYVEVAISEVENNNQISDCLNFGISEILEDSENYSIDTINSCYSQVIKSAYYYKFDVKLTGSSDVSVSLQFIVYYKPDSDQQFVTAYSIDTIINSESSDADDDEEDSDIYTEEDASNSDYDGIVEEGSKKCVEDLFKNNVIISTDFSVSQVNKVFTSKLSTSIRYQFEVTLKNSAGVTLDLTLNLKLSTSSSKTDIKLVSYFVLGTSVDQSDALVSDHSENSQTQNSNCQEVSQADDEAKEAVNYGAQEVITKITEKFETSSDFEISETHSVHQEVVNSSSYKVKVTLKNSEGKKADCHYSVKYNSSTNVKQVTSYKYIVY